MHCLPQSRTKKRMTIEQRAGSERITLFNTDCTTYRIRIQHGDCTSWKQKRYKRGEAQDRNNVEITVGITGEKYTVYGGKTITSGEAYTHRTKYNRVDSLNTQYS